MLFLQKKKNKNLRGIGTGLELLLINFGETYPPRGLCDRFGVPGGVIPLPFAPCSLEYKHSEETSLKCNF